MSTDYAVPRGEGAYDTRIHLRLSTTLADRLEAAFQTQSQGIRAAMRYAIAESPLSRWPVVTDGRDLEGEAVKRVSVRVAPALDENLSHIVEQESAPGQSRVVRDAARDLLA